MKKIDFEMKIVGFPVVPKVEQQSALGHLVKFFSIGDNEVRKLEFRCFRNQKCRFIVAFGEPERLIHQNMRLLPHKFELNQI